MRFCECNSQKYRWRDVALINGNYYKVDEEVFLVEEEKDKPDATFDISPIEIKLDRLKVKKEKLFQKLMDNQISDDEYMKLSDEVEREQIIVEDKIRELKKKQKTVLAAKKEKETTVKTYKEIGAIKKIDRNVVDKLINKMIVSKEGRVELHWNFKNIFAC